MLNSQKFYLLLDLLKKFFSIFKRIFKSIFELCIFSFQQQHKLTIAWRYFMQILAVKDGDIYMYIYIRHNSMKPSLGKENQVLCESYLRWCAVSSCDFPLNVLAISPVGDLQSPE